MLKSGPVSAFALLATAAFTAAGCGGPSEFKNKARPAAPVQLTGVIKDDKLTVSPNKVGAGPLILLISNQTRQAHFVILDFPGTTNDPTVGPINPLDNAKLQDDLEEGSYMVRAGSNAAPAREIKPATLTVGPPRQDSSSKVLLP